MQTRPISSARLGHKFSWVPTACLGKWESKPLAYVKGELQIKGEASPSRQAKAYPCSKTAPGSRQPQWARARQCVGPLLPSWAWGLLLTGQIIFGLLWKVSYFSWKQQKAQMSLACLEQRGYSTHTTGNHSALDKPRYFLQVQRSTCLFVQHLVCVHVLHKGQQKWQFSSITLNRQ